MFTLKPKGGWRNYPLPLNTVWFKIWLNFMKKKSPCVGSVKQVLKNSHTDGGVILGGMTSLLKPFDLGVNKPFKDNLRQWWNKWMLHQTFISQMLHHKGTWWYETIQYSLGRNGVWSLCWWWRREVYCRQRRWTVMCWWRWSLSLGCLWTGILWHFWENDIDESDFVGF